MSIDKYANKDQYFLIHVLSLTYCTKLIGSHCGTIFYDMKEENVKFPQYVKFTTGDIFKKIKQ